MKITTALFLVCILTLLGFPAHSAPLPVASLTLSWTAPADAVESGVTGYTVYKQEPGAAAFVPLRSVYAVTTSISVLKPVYGTIFYVVSTDNDGNESPRSDTVTNRFGQLNAPGSIKLTR